MKQYRAYDDFKYQSFDTYVMKNEITIRGRLKKGNASLFMKILRKRE